MFRFEIISLFDRFRELTGVTYSVAAIVGTTAMRQRHYFRHEYLPLAFYQSEDANNVIWLFQIWYLLSS
jgi:hypothetical protein